MVIACESSAPERAVRKIDTFLSGEESSLYHFTAYMYFSILLMSLGGAMVLVSVIGCCGAVSHSLYLILSHCILSALTLITSLSILAAILVFGAELDSQVEESAKAQLALYGNPNYEGVTSAVDTTQRELDCCGVANGPIDWSNGRRYSFATYWISKRSKDVPDSCCVEESIDCGLGKALKVAELEEDSTVWKDGCKSVLISKLEGQLVLLRVVAGLAVVLPLLGAVGSFYLRKFLVSNSDVFYE